MAPIACKPGNGAVSQPIEVQIFMSGSVILRCWAENQESYPHQQLTFRTLPVCGLGAKSTAEEGHSPPPAYTVLCSRTNMPYYSRLRLDRQTSGIDDGFSKEAAIAPTIDSDSTI